MQNRFDDVASARPTLETAGPRVLPVLPEARPGVRVPVVERLYADLKQRIYLGEFLPGFHLVEADLTAEYGVSRVTVRESMRRLLADDLVELLPHRGIRVRRYTLRELDDLYAVAEPIESLAARLAAERPSAESAELQQIHARAEAFVDAGNTAEYLRLNSRFHRCLAEAGGNRVLLDVLERLEARKRTYDFFTANPDIAESHRQHGEVLAAVLRGDPTAAEAAMRRHVRASRREITTAVTALSRRAAAS